MLKLLEKSGVFVHLDPRRNGVAVPNWFRKQPELVLQVGLNMAVAIPDLEVDDEGIFCTLSFNRSPFYCRLPWHAVYALMGDEDRRGVVWPEDAPAESQLASKAVAAKKPKLRAVGPDEVAEAEPAPAEAPTAEGTCGECGVRWLPDQTSCPVCGAGVEAFVAAAGSADEPELAPAAIALDAPVAVPADEATPKAEPPADEPPPSDEPKAKRPLPPYLRVVK